MTRRAQRLALRCVRAIGRGVVHLDLLLNQIEEALVAEVDVYSAPEAARAAEEMREAWSEGSWVVPNLVVARPCTACGKPTHYISDWGSCASCALGAIS